MIYIRDDDVLLPSSGWPDPPSRFKFVHEIIVEGGGKFLHIPTILCGQIQQWPETVRFIRDETEEGRMAPQLHGWEHIDYAKLSRVEIEHDLTKCIRWMQDNLGVRPTKFYTPWGANASHIYEVGQELELDIVDCSNIIIPKTIWNDLDSSYDKYNEKEIFIHWWEGMGRLKDIVKALS